MFSFKKHVSIDKNSYSFNLKNDIYIYIVIVANIVIINRESIKIIVYILLVCITTESDPN